MINDCVMIALIAFAISIFLLKYILKHRFQKTKTKLAEYKLIYRVISVPSDNQIVLKADGGAIEIGDFGWEAEPVYQDGLIYLHGLNPRWQVVWYAGFRPDQIEVVRPKPNSQYYYISPYASVEKIPQCPFPIREYRYGKRPATHFGFPEQIHPKSKWVQGEQISIIK